MKLLKQGESASKSTVVEGKIAHCTHTSVHPSIEKGSKYQVRWSISFEDMSEEEILKAAAEHFIIRIRRDFAKDENPHNDNWNNVTFKAKDYLSTQRTSKIEKITKQLEQFTDEELAAMGLTRT